MVSSNDVGKKILQFYQELLNAYKKNSFFIGNGGGWRVVCAVLDVTQEGSCKQT